MLAISTAWNYKPDANMRDMLSQIKSAGFDTIELGYKCTHEKLEELIPLLDELQVKVSSIHNFCPLPSDGPSPRHPSNYYRLSALDEGERSKAVKWTKIAIDTAVRVQARAVVIHAGTVEMDDGLSERLLKLCKLGDKSVEEFHDTREELLKQRAEKRVPYMESIKKSFADIMPYAKERKVIIGLETRYYPTEIPNFAEIGELLDLFYNQGMQYWHDFGHAEVNGRLGITPHEDYLKAYHERLVGYHIHGVKGLQDHLAPFDGDFDIAPLLSFVGDEHIKVIEAHSQASLEQLKNARKKLS